MRAVYDTLEGQCLHTKTLPSLAYGGKSCSLKFKRRCQDIFVRGWRPAQECWQQGRKVVKAIGYDAGPADSRRFRYTEDEEYTYWYPLAQWRHDRHDCESIIRSAGLPVPMKSSCFFCPASKKHEIVWLQEHHPDLLQRALTIERNARDSLTTVRGLGRSFSWEEYLAQRDDLPLFSGLAG
jgi:hypothetical protein